jgi:hypothetical protein
MEKPVHNNDEHDDCKQSSNRLNVERWHVLGQVINDVYGKTPSEQGRNKCDTRSHSNGTLVPPTGSDHTGGDRREHQNTLQPFTKDEYANLKHDGSLVGSCGSGINRCCA